MHHDQFVQLVRIQVDDMQHRLFYVSQKLMKLERAEVEKREVGKFEMKLGSSGRNWKVQPWLERTFKLENFKLKKNFLTSAKLYNFGKSPMSEKPFQLRSVVFNSNGNFPTSQFFEVHFPTSFKPQMLQNNP